METLPTKKSNKMLPSISELYSDTEMVIKQNKLNQLLNHEPKKDWIGFHPFIKIERIDPSTGKKYKEPMPYIPIQRLEWLMSYIFTKWKVEIKESKLIANSVVVTVRVHYQDPITGEWEWTDGIGAAPLQTDKDSGATDFNRIKSNAVQIGAPAAAAFAFKNAVAKLGRLFGKDLVRTDEVVYDFDPVNIEIERKALRKEISDLLDVYQDVDKESIIDMVVEKEDSGEATIEFYQNIIKQLRGKGDAS